MNNPNPKFRDNQLAKSANGVLGTVKKIGDRFSKNKKGEPIFETYSYILKDAAGGIHYFLEEDLK